LQLENQKPSNQNRRIVMKWEYLVLDNNENSVYEQLSLNDAGKNGWELVSIVSLPQFGRRAYFKREIPEPQDKMSNVQRANEIANKECSCGHEYWEHQTLGGACDCIGCDCKEFAEPPKKHLPLASFGDAEPSIQNVQNPEPPKDRNVRVALGYQEGRKTGDVTIVQLPNQT
jgi:hypothetical protein